MTIDAFGMVAVAAMLVTYAFERRWHGFVLGFAVASASAAAFAIAIEEWPFAAVEGVWGARRPPPLAERSRD